jgi:hypothetical protein
MKKFLITLIAVVAINHVAFSAVECEKKNGRWYPKNELAKSIALNLGVKTCNGKRFKDVVTALNETSNVTTSKKNLSVEETVKLLGKK